MRRTLKKLLVILLIILTLNNFIMTSSFANDSSDVNSISAIGEKIQGLLNSVIALLTVPVRAIALGAALGINLLTASVAYIEGTTENSNVENVSIITPFDIFFNRVKILDINFFDIGNDNSLVTQIRTSVAAWYYVLRNIAAAILLVILIYVGIRMALSTVASDKAMYKKMLFDWVASLALIFVIQYIIIFAVSVNQSIIDAMEAGVNSEEISNTYKVITTLAFDITDLDSIAATIIFCMLVWQTLGLVISYFNRMLKLAFLIIISPLITLTYSIDKMGDGKAQALGAWLREFIYTILIQPFHCIIYMCFIDVAFKLLIENTQGADNSNTLGVAVVAILAVRFVKEAEKLIRKIFAFKDDNSSTSMTAGLAMAGMALSQSKNIGKSARGMINGVRGTAGALSASITGAKVGIMARKMRIADKVSGKNEDKIIDEYKEDARTALNNKKAEKLEHKLNRKHKYTLEKESKDIKNEVASIKELIPGIKDKEAESIARLNVAKRVRSKTGIRKPITAARGAINKVNTAARGAINKVKTVADSSEVLKGISTFTKGSISAGMGLMVGSGIYGTNGNLGTALTGGAAMFSGTQAFQKTAATFEKDASKNIQAAGGTDKESGTLIVADLMNNSAIYKKGDQATQRMTELLENLVKALEAAGINSTNKNKIKNMIEKGIKADPTSMPQIIQNALGTIENPKGLDLNSVNNGQILRATQDLADYVNKRELYNKVEQAANFNITADQLLGGAISRLPDKSIDLVSAQTKDNSTEIVNDTMEKVITVEEGEEDKYLAGKNELDTLVSGLTGTQIKNLEEEFQARIEERKKEIYTLQTQMDADNKEEIKKQIEEIKKQISDIEREQIDIISKAISETSDKQDDKLIEKMKNKYGELLAKKIAEKKAEFTALPEKNIGLEAVQYKRMQVTYQNLFGQSSQN